MIRTVTAEDIPAIVDALETMRLESPTYKACPADPDWWSTTLTSMIQSTTFGVIHDEYDGFMLGVASPTWYQRRVDAHEMILYVQPDRRGGMLAARLIRAFEQECRARNAHTLHVGVSSGMNEERTEALYLRLGYTWHGRSLTKVL